MALTGDSEGLKGSEVSFWRDRGTVGRREGLDGVLDGCFAGGLEHPTDLDGRVVVAHEGDGGCGRGVLAGEWAKQGCYGRLEEGVVAGPGLFRVGRSGEESRHDASGHAPPLLVPFRRVERLMGGGAFSEQERRVGKMRKHTMAEGEGWDDGEATAEGITDYIL